MAALQYSALLPRGWPAGVRCVSHCCSCFITSPPARRHSDIDLSLALQPANASASDAASILHRIAAELHSFLPISDLVIAATARVPVMFIPRLLQVQ